MKLIRNYIIIFIVAFLFSSCGDNITGVQGVSLNQEFELGVNQTAHVKDTDLLITFVKVVEDSRCPEGAICIWQGNAKIELIINTRTQMQIDSLNTFLEPKELHLYGFRIELKELMPYPVIDVDKPMDRYIDPDDYQIKLKVSLLQLIDPL